MDKKEKNIGTLMHLSTFTQFFIPFGNFIGPLLLWTIYKNDRFVNQHGKECLNFQISLFLYAAAIGIISFIGVLFIGLKNIKWDTLYHTDDFVRLSDYPELYPFVVFFIVILMLIMGLFLFNIICVIQAAFKASEGKDYHYPLSIPFLPIEKTNDSSTSKTVSS